MFSGPSILQAPGEGFPLSGSRFQGCHGYLPSGLWLLLPTNLLRTSSQAHLFVTSLNVAKYNLGKVRLELMQSAVFPSTVHDLRGGPFGDLQGFCVALPFLLQCYLLISICKSLRILAPSHPSRLVAGL